MASFDLSHKITGIEEGGFNPRDTNGKRAMYGLNEAWNSDWVGWKVIDSSGETDPKRINKIVSSDKASMDDAKRIFKDRYYAPLKADLIKDQSVANVLYDYSVNSDPNTAIKQSRVALGLSPKGGADSEFISRINSNPKEATKAITNSRIAYIQSLANLSKEEKKSLIARATRIGDNLEYTRKSAESDVLATKELEDNRANASFLEKYASTSMSALKETMVWDVAVALAKTDIGSEKDDSWISYINNEQNLVSELQINNLDTSYARQLRTTTSREHFDKMLNVLNNEKKVDSFINNRIGEGLQTFGAIAGVVASPENLLLPLAIPMRAGMAMNVAGRTLAIETAYNGFATASSISKYSSAVKGIKQVAYAQTAGLAVGVPAIRYATSDNYGLDEAVLDFVTYGAFDGFMLSKQIGGKSAEIASEMNRIKHDTEALKAQYVSNMQSDMFSGIRARVSNDINAQYSNIAKQTVSDLSVLSRQLESEANDAFELYRVDGSIENYNRYQDSVAAYRKSIDELSIASNIVKHGEIDDIKSLITSYGAKLEKITGSKTILDDIGELSNNIDELQSVRILDDEVDNISKEASKIDELSNFIKDGKSETKIKPNKDGTFTVKGLNGAKFKLPAVVVATVLATQAEALGMSGEGSSDSSWSPVTIMSAIALGYIGLNVLGSKAQRLGTTKIGAIKEIATSVYEKSVAKKAGADISTIARAGEIIDNTFQQTRTSLTETLKPILDGTDEYAKEVASSLFHNADDGSKLNVEDIKNIQHKSAASIFHDKSADAIAGHREEVLSNLSSIERYANPMAVGNADSKLYKEAYFEAMFPGLSKNKYASGVAKAFHAATNHLLDTAIASGVAGAGDKIIKNYVPLIWKNDNARVLIMETTPLGGNFTDSIAYRQIKDRLSLSYSAIGYPNEKVDEIVELKMKEIMDSSGRVKGGEFEEVFGDVSGRFKDRYNIDPRQFGTFDIVIGDKTTTIGISDILETDLNILFDSYSKNLSAHIALAKSNPRWSSYTVAYDDILKVSNPTVQRTLTRELDSLLNKNMYDTSETGAKISTIAKNVSSFVFLPLAVVNTVAENLKLLHKTTHYGMGFSMALKQFAKTTTDFGYDSSFVSRMSDFFGMGKDMKISKLGYRDTFEPVHSVGDYNTGIIDDITVASSRLRDNLFMYNQLGKMTDLDRMWSMELNINILAQYLNGATKINPIDLKVYGITDDTFKILKDKLPLNGKGYVKAHDPYKDGWSQLEIDEYQKVINNMVQTDIQMHTRGGTAHYTRSSPFGNAISAVMGFPMQAYATHASRDVRGMTHGSLEHYMSTALWFAGGYATYYIKAGLQGKEIDDDEALEYALKNMPVASIDVVPTMLTDPIYTSAFQQLEKSPVNTYNMLIEMSK